MRLVRHFIEAVILLILMKSLRTLGLKRASNFGGWIAKIIGPKMKVNKTAKRNISLAFPKKSEEEIKKITIKMWENIGRTTFEYAFLDKFFCYSPKKNITVNGEEILDSILDSQKPAVFFSAHTANFELLPLCISQKRKNKICEIYRSPNNPLVAKMITNMRNKYICKQVAKGSYGSKELINLINQKYNVAVLVDQKLREGIDVSLFNIKAKTSTMPAKLAIRHNYQIVPYWIERKEGANFVITISPPFIEEHHGSQEERIRKITEKINDVLENQIRKHVPAWFWLHNRWSE